MTIDKDITNVGLEDIKSPEKPYAILFKATDGLSDKKKRVKISTVVDADELTKFWMSYTELMKIGMSGLRKKRRRGSQRSQRRRREKDLLLLSVSLCYMFDICIWFTVVLYIFTHITTSFRYPMGAEPPPPFQSF